MPAVPVVIRPPTVTLTFFLPRFTRTPGATLNDFRKRNAMWGCLSLPYNDDGQRVVAVDVDYRLRADHNSAADLVGCINTLSALACVREGLTGNITVLPADLHAPSKESIRLEVSGTDWLR